MYQLKVSIIVADESNVIEFFKMMYRKPIPTHSLLHKIWAQEFHSRVNCRVLKCALWAALRVCARKTDAGNTHGVSQKGGAESLLQVVVFDLAGS